MGAGLRPLLFLAKAPGFARWKQSHLPPTLKRELLFMGLDDFFAPSRIRTCDHLLKRELLYQLSYGCKKVIITLKAKLLAFNPTELLAPPQFY